LALEVDMLVDPVPGPAWVATVGPAPVVVEPETLPPPAVTCELMLPVDEAELVGAFSPGFRCTVLQLPLGAEEDETRPSEEAELEELELSAWAAKATTLANATAQTIGFFMKVLPIKRPDGPKAVPPIEVKMN
jgi:hypothetical protein